MIRSALVLATASSLALAGCVQTRQFADVEFTPPQGDFSMLVMRPYVSVGQIQTGGLVEPRAEWTEQARGFILEALREQQAARGGRTEILESRGGVRGMSDQDVAEIERLFMAVGNAIVIHRYAGFNLPTKRRQGLDWTLGQDAVRLGQATGMDYALFLHAQDSYASTGRIALQVLGIAGCLVGFCAPQIGGGSQQAYASLVDLRTGEVVWFNMLQAQTGDIRTREGAAQLVDRLLGRMRAGRNVRNRNDDRNE
jgi:outer membrane lipoprotein SlyB